MSRGLRGLGLLVLCLTGCYGISENPHFPYLLGAGDIVRTHAKPAGPGYFGNFDHRACRLEVNPQESTTPARSRVVLIASVVDGNGKPLKNRRVEWVLEGAGHILEVDESGLFPGRGYKVDNRYAVSYTDHLKHTISPRTGRKAEDFVIQPGQTWCVISSAVEGDTQVSVYAPEVANWDANRVVINQHWLDADWQLPPAVAVRFGTPATLTTRVSRQSDHQPLTFYKVRYKVLDGPPLLLVPPGSSPRAVAEEAHEGTAGTVIMTDLGGRAALTLVQPTPQGGRNRVAVEIIRPPDPRTPGGAVMVIGRGETTIDWQAPAVSLSEMAPASAVVGQEVPYSYVVKNTGAVEAQTLTVRTAIPPGLLYVSSSPEAVVEGEQLLWTLGELGAGASRELKAVFKSTRTGQVVSRTSVVTGEGLRDEKEATTEITPPPTPRLQLAQNGPSDVLLAHDETANADAPVVYQLTVSNPGTGPAANVKLRAEFSGNLEHESRHNPVEMALGSLEAGTSRSVPLTLLARRGGDAICKVTVTADGGLTAQAEHQVRVREAGLTLHLAGPSLRYVNRQAIWDLEVSNIGDQALDKVIVRDLLPPELEFVSAAQGGLLQGREVTWEVGTLKSGEVRKLQLTTTATHPAPKAVNQGVASATLVEAPEPDGKPKGQTAVQAHAEAALVIEGLPAPKLSVKDTADPVEVGGRTTYEIEVSNQGSQADEQVRVACVVPDGLRVVDATGPTLPRREGPRIEFEPLTALHPGQPVRFTVVVEATRPGSFGFRTELTSKTLREPLVRVESTSVR